MNGLERKYFGNKWKILRREIRVSEKSERTKVRRLNEDVADLLEQLDTNEMTPTSIEKVKD